MAERRESRTAAAWTSAAPESGSELEPGTLATPYCWVITEDLVAGYDGVAPSAVGTYGPAGAGHRDVHEALSAGRWFRLTGDDGVPHAVGRIHDPRGENKRAPLEEFGVGEMAAAAIEYRAGGQWEQA